MKSLSLKYLAFYGGTIAFVLGLFTLVISYGEAHLKTAQSIEGNYLLKLPTIANCEGEMPVTLIIQQSGRYVAAALINPALPRNKTAFKPMTLSGQWQNQRLGLAGEVPINVLCEKAKGKALIAVNIEGAITANQNSAQLQPQKTRQGLTEFATLKGTLSLNAKRSPLTAQRQTIPKDDPK